MRLRKRKWVDPLINSDTKYIIQNTNNYNNFILEIGMGMGDFLLESAVNNKDKMFIGIEKDRTCVGKVLKKLDEQNIDNVRILLIDAKNILNYINIDSVEHIYLHFSDPWPKKHHHKRRLTYESFLLLYEKILIDDGLLTFKTDNTNLFNDSLEYFKSSNFLIVKEDRDYHKVLRKEPLTAYERKFIEKGCPIYYLEAKIKKSSRTF